MKARSCKASQATQIFFSPTILQTVWQNCLSLSGWGNPLKLSVNVVKKSCQRSLQSAMQATGKLHNKGRKHMSAVSESVYIIVQLTAHVSLSGLPVSTTLCKLILMHNTTNSSKFEFCVLL